MFWFSELRLIHLRFNRLLWSLGTTLQDSWHIPQLASYDDIMTSQLETGFCSHATLLAILNRVLVILKINNPSIIKS